jgi:hypothetical protein
MSTPGSQLSRLRGHPRRTDWIRGPSSPSRLGVTLLDDPGFVLSARLLAMPDCPPPATQHGAPPGLRTRTPLPAVSAPPATRPFVLCPAFFPPRGRCLARVRHPPGALWAGPIRKNRRRPAKRPQPTRLPRPAWNPDAPLLSRVLGHPSARGESLLWFRRANAAHRAGLAAGRAHFCRVHSRPTGHLADVVRRLPIQLAATSPPTVAAGHWLEAVRCVGSGEGGEM